MFVVTPNTSRSRISRSSSEYAAKEVKSLSHPKFLIDFGNTVSLNARNEQHDEKTFSPETP